MAPDSANCAPTLTDVIGLLDRLHRPKDRAYGDAWRKRGEVLGVFCNIARKADRLEAAMGEDAPSAVEALPDTAADYAVYVGKYLTWLAENHPGPFEAANRGARATQCTAARGPDALLEVLNLVPSREKLMRRVEPRSLTEAWSQVAVSFAVLERGIIAQAQGDASRLDATEKASAAWDLLGSLLYLLVRLSETDPSAWDALQRSVAAGVQP